MCQNATSSSDEFQQAVTLLIDLETNFNMNVTYNVNLGFEIYKLSMKYVEDEDAHFKV